MDINDNAYDDMPASGAVLCLACYGTRSRRESRQNV